MSKAKHTPGPWAICKAKGGTCKCRMIWSGDGEVCVAVAHGEHWKETIGDPWPIDDSADANARLIAAAPKLLEACEAACKYMVTTSNPKSVEAQKLLQDAFAKVEGKHEPD